MWLRFRLQCLCGIVTRLRLRLMLDGSRERNYHIFYMLCDAAAAEPDSGEPSALGLRMLGLQPAASYHYLSRGDRVVSVEGKSDLEDFKQLCATLERLGVRAAVEQRSLFAVLAAILMLGSVTLLPNEDGTSCHIAPEGRSHLAGGTSLTTLAAPHPVLSPPLITVCLLSYASHCLHRYYPYLAFTLLPPCYCLHELPI